MNANVTLSSGHTFMTPKTGERKNRRRLLPRTGDIGRLLIYAIGLQALLIWVSLSFGDEIPALAPTTSVPLVVAQGTTFSLRTLDLQSTSVATPTEENILKIDVTGDQPQAAQRVKSQAWVAALASAFAGQTPWQGASWKIGNVPACDGSASAMEAPLAIAMRIAATGASYPTDTVVLADLSPDGSLMPIPQLAARIDAAAHAGMKKVVISALEKFEIAPNGEKIDIAAKAEALGLTCLAADTLVEATSDVLGQAIPAVSEPSAAPQMAPALFNQLAGECGVTLTALQASRSQWPLDPKAEAALPLWQRALWTEAAVHFQNGVSFLKAGKVYAAREELSETEALVTALTHLKAGVPPLADLEAKALALESDYRGALAKVSDGQEELQNGLVVAEMADWTDGVIADLLGAQNVVHQAFAPHSQVLPEQRALAQAQLALAVEKAEVKKERLASFATLRATLATESPVPVFERASVLLPQLIPAHLAMGEAFVLQMQKANGVAAQEMIYDSRLIAQTRLLRDQALFWKSHESAQTALGKATDAPADFMQVGFTPGDAYRAPLNITTPATTTSTPSATEQTFRWVNDYTEMAALSLRYFQFGGATHVQEVAWNTDDRATLQGMLHNADRAAREGIAAAQATGVDPAILALVYERASALSQSPLDSDRMEALRQYWRCSLMGSLAWQLNAAPRAAAVPALPLVKVDSAREAEILARVDALPNPIPHVPQENPDNQSPTNNPNIDPTPIPTEVLSASAVEEAAPVDENEVRRATLVSFPIDESAEVSITPIR